jgi:hypothetical protein
VDQQALRLRLLREYRPGHFHTVAVALSRRYADQDTDAAVSAGAVFYIKSGPSFAFINDIRLATASAADTHLLRQRLEVGDLGEPWRLDAGLLLHGRRLFVPDHGNLRHQALLLAHSAGHEGVQKTLRRLRADFYIPGDWALVRDWVRSCVTCQRNKTETLWPAGLLQPLEVPSQVWADISMDFIEALPKVGGKSVILTMVDPSTRSSLRSATPTSRHPWRVPSSTTSSAFTGFPCRSSATVTRCSLVMSGAISFGWRG